MNRTHLDEVSQGEEIGKALKDVLTYSYGVAYDHGRADILFYEGKSVLQLDDYGNVVETHVSIRRAARAIGGNASNIRHVIQGRQHQAYGYSWMYENKANYNKKTGDEEIDG